MEERSGEAFEVDEHLTVVGKKLQPGITAPAFTLDSFNEGAMQHIPLADSAGQVRLLNVINSVDTPVCNLETQKWERLRPTLPNSVVVYTISMDLPYAQARWQTNEGVEHRLLSSHRDTQFATDYGVLLKEWRLLQRAVFVIDRNDKIVYAEYVPDQGAEPNYEAAVEAAKQTAAM
jgi:thiol peroxidase